MSVGLIPQQQDVSTRQFTGDLSSLFIRHRITPGSVCAFANFESRFALSESFRSQLLMLCTAISHMSKVDLTAEQLLALIACALRSTSGTAVQLPEWVRAEFQDGYDAWNARDLNKADERQTVSSPVEPNPSCSSKFAILEHVGPDVGTPGDSTHFAPCEVAANMPALKNEGVAGAELEHVALDEVSRLLKKVEHRTEQLKPSIERSGRVAARSKEAVSEAFEQAMRSAPGSVAVSEEAFLRRHAYLQPDRRVLTAARGLQIAVLPRIASVGVVCAAGSAGSLACLPPLAKTAEATATTPLLFGAARKLPRNQRATNADHRFAFFPTGMIRAISTFAASGILIILAGGLAGVVLYPSALATYLDPSSGFGQHAQKSPETTQVAANPDISANASTKSSRRWTTAVPHRATKPK